MSNPTSVVTERRLGAFYQEILPYLGGSADAGFTPVGSVIAIMGVTAPANYLACNGQIVNVADYPELANYFEQQFGTKYKFGGSGTTFGIPDLRGEFLRGTGTNSHTNQGSGSNVGTHQDATEVPNLFGWNTSTANNGQLMLPISTKTASTIPSIEKKRDSEFTTAVGRIVSAQQSFSSGTENCYYTTRPTNTSILWCIATKDIYLNPAMDYSTSEKVVGKWIDGSTLYQKTFEVSGTWGAVGTWVNVDVDTDTTHSWKMTEGYDVGSGGSIPSLSPAVNGSVQYAKTIGLNSGKLALKFFNNLSSIVGGTFNAIVVARYTKTT